MLSPALDTYSDAPAIVVVRLPGAPKRCLPQKAGRHPKQTTVYVDSAGEGQD